MKSFFRIFSLILLQALVLQLVSCKHGNPSPEETSGAEDPVEVVVAVEDFKLAGNNSSFSDYVGKGRFTLVYFWASWSKPSVRQLSRFEDFRQQCLDAGAELDFLSIAVGDSAGIAVPLALEKAPDITALSCSSTLPVELYSLQSLPQVVLFGPDGTLLKRDAGWRALYKAILQSCGSQE
ncbi:MAG: hypothetical protein J5764_04255 [Bacteroidales bacterium]|nr:hypothetical protein [Bacteroidales bacterium]